MYSENKNEADVVNLIQKPPKCDVGPVSRMDVAQ